MSQHHKATALPSEVECRVSTLSGEQNGGKSSQWQCLGKGYERELMMKLVANSPALHVLTGSNENKGSEVVGTEDGEFVVVNLEPSSEGSTGGSEFFHSSDREVGGNLLEIYPAEMYLPWKVLHILRAEDPAHSWSSAFWNICRAE